MSIVFTLAALQQVIPVQVCAAVECLTKPSLALDCSVAEQNKPWRRLKIIRQGGQAFEKPSTDGGRSFERTPVVWSFNDSSGEFDSFKQTELNPVEVWFKNADGTRLIFTDRYSRLVDFSSIRIDTFNRPDNGRRARTYVGICEVTETSQKPLSEGERRQVIKQ